MFVPMRRAIQTDSLCSQCSLKLNYRPHSLSIQVEAFMTKSHRERTGFNHLKTHTQYGVFTHITHATQWKKKMYGRFMQDIITHPNIYLVQIFIYDTMKYFLLKVHELIFPCSFMYICCYT